MASWCNDTSIIMCHLLLWTVKDCGDVERLDAQSGRDTDSSSDNGCLLEETKQGFFSTFNHTGFCEHWLILLVVCFLYRYSIANTWIFWKCYGSSYKFFHFITQWVHVQNNDQSDAYDCQQNVTEHSKTSGHRIWPLSYPHMHNTRTESG